MMIEKSSFSKQLIIDSERSKNLTFEDIKRVIKNRKSKKDRQNNQKKKDKKTNNGSTLHRKLTIEQHEHHLKPGMNSFAAGGLEVPVPQMKSNGLTVISLQ